MNGGFFLGEGVPMLQSVERIIMVNGSCSTKCYTREPGCVGALCTETIKMLSTSLSSNVSYLPDSSSILSGGVNSTICPSFLPVMTPITLSNRDENDHSLEAFDTLLGCICMALMLLNTSNRTKHNAVHFVGQNSAAILSSVDICGSLWCPRDKHLNSVKKLVIKRGPQ